jgi:hypothetical protein
MEVMNMKRLTVLGISLITISLILANQGSAKIDEKNIMGVWLLDEGKGDTAKDSSKNGNDGKIDGPKWVAKGKFGKCLEFAGSGDYVDCGNHESLDYLGEANFTVVAWIQVLTNDGDWHNIVSKKVGYNNTDVGWMAWLDFRDAGAMQLRINDGTTVNDNTPNAPDKTLMGQIQDGDWHHLAWVVTEPGTLTYYLDGKDKGENTFSMKGSTKNSVSLRMGQSEGNSKGIHSNLDEVGIFNISLAEKDIQDLMNNGLSSIAAVDTSGKLTTTWGFLKTLR